MLHVQTATVIDAPVLTHVYINWGFNFAVMPNVEGEEYGDERLGEVLRKTSHLPAKEIVEAVFQSHECFTSGTRMFDDQTVVILKVT